MTALDLLLTRPWGWFETEADYLSMPPLGHYNPAVPGGTEYLPRSHFLALGQGSIWETRYPITWSRVAAQFGVGFSSTIQKMTGVQRSIGVELAETLYLAALRYEQAGAPTAAAESPAHAQWRSDVTEIEALFTALVPSDSSSGPIGQRIVSALKRNDLSASQRTLLRELLERNRAEPRYYGDAYYRSAAHLVEGQTRGEVEATYNSAFAALQKFFEATP